MTHNYKRHGTSTLFAAVDVFSGEVIGECKKRHGHQEFLSFLKTINKQTPRDKGLHVIQACRYLVKDFGTSQSPKSTRQRDSQCAPAALRPPRDPTPRWSAGSHGSHTGLTALGCGLQHGLWRASARRPCLTAWRLPGTTGLGLRPSMASSECCVLAASRAGDGCEMQSLAYPASIGPPTAAAP
jgi:hypothetical protein